MLPACGLLAGTMAAPMNERRRRLACALVLLAVLATSCNLPDLSEEQARATALPQTSFLYAADGTLITQLHAGENRVVVPFDRIPESVRDAVVAVEDRRFYQHKGVDVKALIRAAWIDAASGRIVEGGSTITQQYVKNVYLGNEQTLGRKLDEAALAWQLEQRYSKDEILAKYLNTVYFGEGAYGIQAAAQTYFSRPASRLTLGQSALLAGLIAAPVDADPVPHPERALARRNVVLTDMRDLSMIGQAEYGRAAARPVGLHLPHDRQRYIAPYFVDYLERWFLSNPRFGKTQRDRYDLLFEGGLRIETTLDPELQQRAEGAVNQILLYPDDPYAAITAIDPRSGYVRAMVGGRDYFSRKDRFARVNLATGGSTGRQAGSSFKPFALVAALESGISPQGTFPGSSSTTIALDNGTTWTPENYEGSAYGTISMESATINSVNVAYVEIEKAIGGGDIQVGAQRVIDAAKRMGIRCCTRDTLPIRPLQPYASAVLGTNEVNTLEMASAYGTLATGGNRLQPTPVVRITDPSGNVLYEATPNPRRVVDPGVAAVADDILQKVVQYGTGAAADIGRPEIGKTGTGQMWRDAWFVGAVPQLVAAVWVGFPQGQVSMTYPAVRLSHVLGGTWPAQIWHAFMLEAAAHMPVQQFPAPGPIQYVAVPIDITQSPPCVANPYTPPMNIEVQQFIVGSEPTDRCTEPTSYQFLTVPSVVGLQQARATSILKEAGFNVLVEAQGSSQPVGVVIGQSPSGSAKAQQASIVTITVSDAPPSPGP